MDKMTLSEIIQDIHACEEDMFTYERKYGILTATFYAAYSAGEEPPHISWLGDWNDWAGVYEIWQRRQHQYASAIEVLQQQTPLITLIEKAALREPLPIPA
jgi:hypothetical protein